MRYQSYARVTKSYHGVTFNPGDIKDVPGYINDKTFVRINETTSNTKEPAKQVIETSDSSKTKSKQEDKATEKPQEEKKQVVKPEKVDETLKNENNDQEEK